MERMSFSDYGGASEYDRNGDVRPDRALVVKCTYDEAVKRITFSSTRTCTYELLKQRIEQCFALSAKPFVVSYTDDDGEVTDICTDTDLTDAIRYVYPVTDDPPMSSASSIISGRSLNKGKITLKLRVSVDYDGPSLSDTSSLVSLEEYKNRNGSELSLSLHGSLNGEIEEDAVTVSSKDMGSKYDIYRSNGPKTVISSSSRPSIIKKSSQEAVRKDPWEVQTLGSIPASLASDILDEPSQPIRHNLPSDDGSYVDPESVFERLRLEEDLKSKQPGSSYNSSTLHSERGAAWLRDQNVRTIKSMLGDLPSPSERSYEPSLAAPDDSGSVLSGELALQRASSGKYYYSYTVGSSYAPSLGAPDSGYEDEVSDLHRASIDVVPALSRPTSMAVTGQKTYDYGGAGQSSSSSSDPFADPAEHQYSGYIHPDVPPEVLQFVSSLPPAPPKDPPTCSNCTVMLDTIRYVCSTCGEKRPVRAAGSESGSSDSGKGKDKAVDLSPTATSQHSFPPSPNLAKSSSASSVSSWTMMSDHTSNIPLRSLSDTTLTQTQIRRSPKPLPAIPKHALPSFSTSTVTGSNGAPVSILSDKPPLTSIVGYELCWECLFSAGITHALEMSVAPGKSPQLSHWATSPEDALSQWRRSAPSQKGQLRHAYIEKSWGHQGWQDVEQDNQLGCDCSTCGTSITSQRYKCASCENFTLCRACYSQVHEIHPSHAFLVIPDKRPKSRSVSSNIPPLTLSEGEHSLKHPDVKCMHCMQDIVGARFHCAICDSVDICSNCESAGLPGNLDSSDGSHNSSHIMIKIPYPLDSAELQSASQRAKSLWRGRDASTGDYVRSRRNSLISSYDRTVLGTGMREGPPHLDNTDMMQPDDHGLRCDACNQRIVGVRYQCASCPSLPKPFSLCSSCEERSYIVHDGMHIFFMFPRPLDRPLQVEYPLVPRLYKFPAGPSDRVYDMDHPKAYLKNLLHSTAICDRCMTRIIGEWYRCAYCSKDLCEVCHRMDTHNDNHAFIVFKSLVDIDMIKRFFDLNNPQPIIPYPIYHIL